MRGKDASAEILAASAEGSPPLARERLQNSSNIPTSTGITPACAGKTVKSVALVAAYQDHPRLRGKDCTNSNNSSGLLGSPPLARERPKEEHW